MSVRRHEQQTRTSDSGHGVLAVWLPFCGAGRFETHGGGILVVVEVMLPFLGFLGHNVVYLLAGFLCFCWLKHEEDETASPATRSSETPLSPNFVDLTISVAKTSPQGEAAL